MMTIDSVADLAGVIQLAVAPVFLLAGIAGFLSVMSGRLGRVVDRARVVQSLEVASDHGLSSKKELNILWRRAAITNWAIGMCTTAGLLICVLIVFLFVGSYWSVNMADMLVMLFVMALCFLIVALLLFLKEVQLATRTMRMVRV